MEVIIAVWHRSQANWLFWHEKQEVSNYVSVKAVFFPAFASVFCPCVQGMVFWQLGVMFITLDIVCHRQEKINTVNTVQRFKVFLNGEKSIWKSTNFIDQSHAKRCFRWSNRDVKLGNVSFSLHTNVTWVLGWELLRVIVLQKVLYPNSMQIVSCKIIAPLLSHWF